MERPSNTFQIAEDLHVPVRVDSNWAHLRASLRWSGRADFRGLGIVAKAGPADCWVQDFVAAVRSEAVAIPGPVLVGLEVEVADSVGNLALPSAVEGVDYLLVSDQVIPTPLGILGPLELREEQEGATSVMEVLQTIPTVLIGVMRRHPGIVLARPFSILSRIGIPESWLSRQAVEALASCATASGCAVELNERWRASLPAALDVSLREGVSIVCGCEAQHASGVGRYDYARHVLTRTTRHSWLKTEFPVRPAT